MVVFLIYGLGFPELLILLLMGVMVFVVVIWLFWKLVNGSDHSARVSDLESRVERLERQIDRQYEAISQKVRD
jgi:hypothetical protein